MLGGVRYELRGKKKEEGQRHERVLSAHNNSGQSELDEVKVGETVEEVYNYFVDRIYQTASIPYKTMRSLNANPKWMTDRLMHNIRQKRCMHQRLKTSDGDLRSQYKELVRLD